MTAPRTFPAYIDTVDFKRFEACPEIYSELDFDFVNRIRGVNLGSLLALQKWTRERWPGFYYQQSDGGDGPTGKVILRRLWADYLAWAEA